MFSFDLQPTATVSGDCYKGSMKIPQPTCIPQRLSCDQVINRVTCMQGEISAPCTPTLPNTPETVHMLLIGLCKNYSFK